MQTCPRVPAFVIVGGGVSKSYNSKPMVSCRSDDASLTTSKGKSIITLSRVVSDISIMMFSSQEVHSAFPTTKGCATKATTQKSCHQVSASVRQTTVPLSPRQQHTSTRFSSWILPLGRPLPAPPPLWSVGSTQGISIRKGSSSGRTWQTSRKRARSWCDETRKHRKVACCSLSRSKTIESDERFIDAAVTLSTLSSESCTVQSGHKTFQTRRALPPPPFQLFPARR
jgi:hypothetical protein